MAEWCEPVVSIQRVGAADAVDGHLSWGVLVEPDLVVAPGPLDWVRDDAVSWEVLLASANSGNRPGFVERIRLERVEVLGFDAHPEGAAAALRLTQPSRHRPVGAAFDSEAFRDGLAGSPDVWAALEGCRAVPPGIRDRVPAQILPVVDAWEDTLRRRLVRTRGFQDPGAISVQWCKIFKTCDCSDRWP